jgi:hypothetical protein
MIGHETPKKGRAGAYLRIITPVGVVKITHHNNKRCVRARTSPRRKATPRSSQGSDDDQAGRSDRLPMPTLIGLFALPPARRAQTVLGQAAGPKLASERS